jgi:hypothetical protein
MTCPIWRASRRGRMVSPRALSSSVPRRPQANAWARPAHKSATPPGSGPGPQRRRGACATTRQATPRGPAWSQHTARGPPCPSWPTRWRGPSLTCSSAPPPGRGRSASRVQGAEGVSRPPHGTWQGAAWLERARRLVCRRLCTCRGPEACYPRVRGCAWTATLAPAHAARVARRDVCCPAPEPGTHWRAAEVQPSLCVGRYEGTPVVRGRRGYPPWFAALATAVVTEPHAVCGAATLGGHLSKAMKSEHATDCRRRQALQSGKKGKARSEEWCVS